MRLRVGSPLWLVHGPAPRRRYPTLLGSHDADVVIVGGGMTGAGIAHVFAAAGLRVVLAEADLVGRGSTGASTALLMHETDEELGSLAKRYGPKRAARIWKLSRSASRDLIATLRRLRISCDLEECATIYYTSDAAAAARLRAECRRRHNRGFSAAWLTPEALKADAGIVGEGAIRSTGNARFDPYRACIGLLGAAEGRGARVFERSPVRRVDPTRQGVTVRTAKGTITATRVVIATGFATPAFKPLAGRFSMKHTYVLATAPISRAQRARLGLGDVLIWEAKRPYHYARWTPDRRLLLGGNDRPVVAPARRRQAFDAGTRKLRQYFETLLPALSDVEIELAWEGLFAITPDGLPYIGPHRRYPRHLFALGYGGNGMTFGFLAARLLLDAVRDVPNRDLELFAFNRHR
jgi:glycine/D-amino acid oxidase-like deaminating enzyme